MKKILAMFLVLSLLVGCSQVAQVEDSGSAVEKTVQVTGAGHSKGLILDVTFEGNAIKNIGIVEHKESPGISDNAIVEIPKQIVENNSILVDNVTGATETSEGIKSAVKKAIEEAGLNIADFEKEVSKGEKAQDQELDTDVVVVGGGIAGLSAALEVSNAGKDVILVEKMGNIGGSTSMSGGLILAAESSIQEALNANETSEDLTNYWFETSEEQADKKLLEIAANNSGENIDWLIEQGVDIKDEVTKLHSSFDKAFGHAVDGYDTHSGGGAGMTGVLADRIEEKGGKILLNTAAKELLMDGDTVVGIKASGKDGETITINASKTILATGGFAANEDMMKEYHPWLKDYVHGGNSGNTGDGINMAMDIGAKTLFRDAGIDITVNSGTYYGYGEEFKGLMVTPDGKRFMDESLFHFTRSRILMDTPYNTAWAITDQGNERVDAAIEMGTAFVGQTVEELAAQIDMDPAKLQATIDRYNEISAAKEDADFGKSSDYLQPIQGPYYALNLYMNNSGSIGGLVINENAQVLNESDQAIPGLYAAGEVANGQFMYRQYPGSGTAISIYLNYGRIAGKHAAQSVE